MKVALTMPPKLLQNSGKKKNGVCSASSMPLSVAPAPLVIELIVHSWPSGLIAAGELGGMIVVGRPVEAKVPLRVSPTGKLAMSLRNSATEAIASGAKYHSSARS